MFDLLVILEQIICLFTDMEKKFVILTQRSRVCSSQILNLTKLKSYD